MTMVGRYNRMQKELARKRDGVKYQLHKHLEKVKEFRKQIDALNEEIEAKAYKCRLNKKPVFTKPKLYVAYDTDYKTTENS